MIKPLQAILMSGELARDEVIQGHKTSTIRMGWRDYETGFIMIGCPTLGWCIGARIVEVSHYFLKEIPMRDLQKSGYKDLDEALNDLKRLYTDVTPLSQVTFVQWERT